MKFTFPGHRYLGPGNPLDNGEPVDSDDKIAQIHDTEYSQAKTKTDIFQSDQKAISAFSRDFILNRNWHSGVGALGLGIKYGTEKVLDHVLYPTGMNNEATPTKKRKGDEVSPEDSPQKPSTSSAVGDPAQPAPATIDDPMTGGAMTGGASSGSMGGGNVNDLFHGEAQEQQWQQRVYQKTYRWTLNSTLPSYLKPSVAASDVLYKPGSLYSMPVHAIWTYLSPQEFTDLLNFPMVKCNGVQMEIYSLGIRLPFTTNEAASVTANASSQYPIVKMSDAFAKAYRMQMDGVELTSIRNKMVGDTAQEWAVADNYSSTFSNLSARSTSREYTMETVLNMNEGAYSRAQGGTARFANSYGTPNTHEFVEQSLNGTTNLGKVFEYTYKPINNTVQCISTHNMRVGRSTAGGANVAAVGMGKQQFQEMNGITPNQNANIGNIQTMIAAPFVTYENAVVEQSAMIDSGKEFENHRQPPFIIGMQFLRNEDDSLLTAKWEIIMKCSIILSLRTGTTGVYGVNPDLKISQNLYPSWVPGSTGNSGVANATWTYGFEYREANLGVDQTAAWWNRPMGVLATRTASNINPYPGAPNATPLVSENAPVEGGNFGGDHKTKKKQTPNT